MNKTIRTALTIAAFLPLSAVANPAGNTEKADYLFRHNAYNEALKEYERKKKEAPRRKDAVLDARIADCYRLTGQPQLAAAWYARAIGAPRGAAKEVKLHYGEVLMTLGCYDDAAYWIRQYASAAPGSRRAANMLRGCKLAQDALAAKAEGTATFLSINTDGADFAPALNNGSLIFTSNAVNAGGARKDKWTGASYDNIYKVSCTGDGNCQADYQQLGGKVSSKFHDGVASFTGDGRQMYFTRTVTAGDVFGQSAVADDQGTVHLEIMIAEDYDAAAREYKKIVPFAYNSKTYSTIHPAISPDGSTLIFASDMPGGEGGTDLYISHKDAAGKWAPPVNMGKAINTEAEELFPVFIDGHTITFASNGLPGFGGQDVFYASLDAGTWGTPVNAGVPVNSSYDDMSLTLAAGGLGGYFASNRPAPKTGDNIYYYFRQSLFLDAMVLDSFSRRPLDGAAVSLLPGSSTPLSLHAVNGTVQCSLEPRTTYEVRIRQAGYRDYATTLAANTFNRVKDTARPQFLLMPDANVAYTAQVLDEASGLPVENPLLVVTRDGTNEADTINMQTGRTFNKLLQAGATYRINAIKDQYYSDERVINTAAYAPDRIVRIADTVLMCRLSIGAICQIGDIFYDFNEAAIRPDALPSLGKVLKLLHQNPKLKLQINSHTDCRGSDAYNRQLSDARAAGVIRYLQSKGIDAARLRAKGYGETMAAQKCSDCEACSEDQHQRNRRTEFMVLAM